MQTTATLKVDLTERSKSLQLVVIIGAVRPAQLEKLVLAVAGGFAQQSPVGP